MPFPQAIADAKYVSLSTFRRNGRPVPTPVWAVGLPDGRLGIWTNGGSHKIGRLGRDPRVTLQPCSVRGKVEDGAPLVHGTAEVSRASDDLALVRRGISRKYGVVGWVSIHLRLDRSTDVAVLVTPAS
jgi:PPOX class probable F420-dependent enzyme